MHDFKKIGLIGLFALMSALSMYTFQKNQVQILQTSLFNVENAPSFDGTIRPIEFVPNWALLTKEQQSQNYNQFSLDDLISLPEYDPSKLPANITDLPFGSKEYIELTNLKVTYPVTYLGNYELDGKEEAGSHPAIDIRVPKGTPIKAIANGIVVRTKMSDSGFGNYVTIGHYLAPTINSAKTKQTIFSTYAHLDNILIAENMTIKKGQIIGLSGESGIATVPHLHLQIDTESAPFIPYWPFTSTEAKNAGYSFFEAINNGLGQENAKLYTLNSMKYVQTYLNFDQENTQDSGPAPQLETPTTVDTNSGQISALPETIEPPTETQLENQPNPQNPVSIQNFSKLVMQHDQIYTIDIPILISIKAINEQGEIVSEPKFETQIKVEVFPEIHQLQKNYLNQEDFLNGEAIISINAKSIGQMRISLLYQNELFESDEIYVLGKQGSATNIKIESDGEFLALEDEIILIKLLDQEGNSARVESEMEPFKIDFIQGKGEIKPSALQPTDFQDSIGRITLTPKNTDDIKLKVQNTLLSAESELISGKIFSDIEKNHLNASAIFDLKKRGIIEGYPDHSFQPNKSVSRVEALKMIFNSSNKEIILPGPLPFPDTQNNVWYTPYVSTAENLKIVEGYPDGSFKPENTVSRAEFFKILFLTLEIPLPENGLGDQFNDVLNTDWYATYGMLVKKMNLLDTTDNLFEPAREMNRAETVEAIYRLLYILENKISIHLRPAGVEPAT